MRYYIQIRNCFLAGIAMLALGCAKEHAPNLSPEYVIGDTTRFFVNPIKRTVADPYVTSKDGYYYYMNTVANYLVLTRAQQMIFINSAYSKTIFTPPVTSAYRANVSKPELHFLNNKWYAYFSADNGNEINRRIYAVENSSTDPLLGNWEFKGMVADTAKNLFASDGSVFEYKGQLYFIWSGLSAMPTSQYLVQKKIIIAKMKDPYTLDGGGVVISSPTADWEKYQYTRVENNVTVTYNDHTNQNPQAIKNAAGDVFITFTGSECETDNVGLGLLSLVKDSDPMIPANWVKSAGPVFTSSREAYGPAFNGFFKSNDGTEDWIMYTANPLPGQGCGARSLRIQKFGWKADGSPDFGTPVGTTTKADTLLRPSR